MATWKELGEVPDSDDEDALDTEESQKSTTSLPKTTTGTEGRLPTSSGAAQKIDDEVDSQDEDDDVWLVPTSLSQERRSLKRSVSSTKRRASIPVPQAPIEIPSSPLSELEGDELDELTRTFDTNPVQPDTVPTPTEQAVPTDQSEANWDAVLNDNGGGLDELGYPSQAFEYGTRSLRPRKPIQEHPYLLENAQYSKLFKSHGVRPVRVAVEESQAPQPEKDSQEQDYEDDSQPSGRFENSNRIDESRQFDLDDIFADEDDLALTPRQEDVMPLPDSIPTRPNLNDPVADADDEDDDLPDVGDIGKWKPRKRAKLSADSTPRNATGRPRLKHPNSLKMPKALSSSLQPSGVFDVPPSPPDTSPALHATTPRVTGVLGKRAQVLTPQASSALDSSRPQSPTLSRLNNFVVDLSKSTIDSELSANETEGDGTACGSDSDTPPDIVETVGKRIRGVLPASWLRLDQKQVKSGPRTRLPLQRSPAKSPRKGVAKRRTISGVGPASAGIFFDDSDESNDETTLRIHESILEQESSIQRERESVFDDDAGSAMEDDQVDHMLPTSRRRSRIGQSLRLTKRSKASTTSSHSGSIRKLKQTKISDPVARTGRLRDNPPTKRSSTNGQQHQRQNRDEPRRAMAATKPKRLAPRLGILDVIEPNAPSFMRIAARTTKKRADKGRASPTHKCISLGVRKDNIDVVKTLSAWRNGSVQPRAAVTALSSKRIGTSEPLQPKSGNITHSARNALGSYKPQKPSSNQFVGLRRQIQITQTTEFSDSQGHIGMTQLQQVPKSPPKLTSTDRQHRSELRPAMLETHGAKGHRTFDNTKRALDAVFRRSRKNVPSLILALETGVNNQQVAQKMAQESSVPRGSTNKSQQDRVVRRKKRAPPVWVDTAAPQYSRANDPVQIESNSSPASLDLDTGPNSGGKLRGLSAFGTLYTHHFEIFPLDTGVFFRQDTVIGSGRLALALGLPSAAGTCHQDRVFVLGEKTLCWSSWTSETSSEFGILFDWVLEEIVSATSSSVSCSSSTARGLYFALDFMQEHLDLSVPETRQSFYTRFCSVMQTFVQGFEEMNNSSNAISRQCLDTLSLTLLILSQGLFSARHLNMTSEIFRIESLLSQLSKSIVIILLRDELGEVGQLYERLQDSALRDTGICNEYPTVICWVCLMHILRAAKIPRSDFWDIVASVVLDRETQLSCDAARFEKIWQTMFTLLPLGEFDANGVLVAGLRRTLPLEGWTIPQKLLGSVFTIYKANQQQSPSFNDYCRALLGRCHYLLEQWGWYKASTIIGVVFDFFASQGLAHLRHEEAYASPQFLEELATSPSLVVTASDRCFHIFLKLLAMTIKRFASTGAIKDTRNLMARVMPNHDRQFSKEMDMHQSDLAALRNHHDLLCTLFWAAPVDCRPSVQMIERLVQPETSHKEACLVNLRAWSQLSRFVTTEHSDIAAYRPLASWIRNITQQLLQQYRSAETDVKQQFASMSKEASKDVSQDLIDIVISTNKKAALEALGASMSTVLSTMQHVSSLNVATLVFSNYPFELVFAELQDPIADSGWRCLQLGLDVVDSYLSAIVSFSSTLVQSNPNEPWHAEEAMELLERAVAKYVFRTARGALKQDMSQPATVTHLKCLEKLVGVCGRLGARLCQAQLVDVSSFFGTGRFAAFPGPYEGGVDLSRKYLSLFVATLIANQVEEFHTLKPPSTMLGLLLHAIVKPCRYLQYENRFAAAIKFTRSPYLQRITVHGEVIPSYASNRDLFSGITKNMRSQLQITEPNRRTALKIEFAAMMRSIMDQVKADLRLVMTDHKEHHTYIEFVRMIISLIRAQDFCPVDQFFYQISPEFTPSSQDPRLQAAGILSYGLKLEDDDPRAGPGLFYLLLANFKIALANGRLVEERSILMDGASNTYVFNFLLGRMLPALIKAAGTAAEAWVLVETYAKALCDTLSTPALHRSIGKENIPAILNLYISAFGTIHHMTTMDVALLAAEHLHSLTMVFMALNALAPSVVVFFLMANLELDIEDDDLRKLCEVVSLISDFVGPAASYLDGLASLRSTDNDTEGPSIVPSLLFDGVDAWGVARVQGVEAQVNDFSQHIIDDISRNWVLTGSMLTIRGPSRPQGPTSTQSGRGVEVPKWERAQLVSELSTQLWGWISHFGFRKRVITLPGRERSWSVDL